ncbi:MAG: repressor LexA [Clostridia bacterium]|nr:repressor LexA [Clostridia bacterium]
MRSKDKELMASIERFISNFTDNAGISPTMQEVADGVGSSKATVQRYIAQMRKDGILDYSGWRTMVTTKSKSPIARVPLLGSVACGIPKFAEENIEEYLPLPLSLIGKGDFFILRANGDSMIEAGIDDGDLVIVRRQNSANEGQMVVALVDDEATLKRFYPEKGRIRLHPENSSMEDIYVDNCEIQGIAVKVLKDIEQ